MSYQNIERQLFLYPIVLSNHALISLMWKLTIHISWLETFIHHFPIGILNPLFQKYLFQFLLSDFDSMLDKEPEKSLSVDSDYNNLFFVMFIKKAEVEEKNWLCVASK